MKFVNSTKTKISRGETIHPSLPQIINTDIYIYYIICEMSVYDKIFARN